MKPASVSQSRIVTSIEDSLVALFAGRPELYGFTVKLDGELVLCDIGLWPQQRTESVSLICEEIRATLLALLEEEPGARRLLAGRTFARALH
jgi:hypothetical protein